MPPRRSLLPFSGRPSCYGYPRRKITLARAAHKSAASPTDRGPGGVSGRTLCTARPGGRRSRLRQPQVGPCRAAGWNIGAREGREVAPTCRSARAMQTRDDRALAVVAVAGVLTLLAARQDRIQDTL